MKFQYKLLILLFIFTGQGCSKFLDIAPPKDQLSTGSVFQLNETAIGAMSSVYAAMINSIELHPARLAVLTGLSSDELVVNSSDQDQIGMYRNDLLATNSYSTDLWTKAYNVIFQANAVYESCVPATLLTADVKKQLMAEARFARAYWFFYLVNLYGDLPLTTTSDYKINSTLPRSPVAAVYEQILADLEYAKDNLNAGYLKSDLLIIGDDRIRPNKAVASALLARLYFYLKRYAEAEAEASSIITQTATYSLPSLDDAFLMNSKETIWALTPTTPGPGNTPEGAEFVVTTSPSTTSQTTISNSLINTFDSSDQRKNHWIGKFTDASVTPNVDYYYPNKYKIKTATAITEYSILFRLGEQYLIRAEARAHQNNLSGAIADIDMIRQRAGITLVANSNPGIAKDALIALILKERQLELFTELGHRWLDLKRTGTIDAVMVPATASKGGTWNSLKQLWPLPQTEILNNPNIKQNESYN